MHSHFFRTASSHLKENWRLLLLTACSFLFLTVAAQLEMFALGLFTDSTVDFFSLFAPEGHDPSLGSPNIIRCEDISSRVAQISGGSGELSKQEVYHYLAERERPDGGNPLIYCKQKIQSYCAVKTPFGATILLFIFAALFKAIWLFFNRYWTQLLVLRLAADLRKKYFYQVQRMSLDFFHQHSTGTLSSRIVNDSQHIAAAAHAFLSHYFYVPLVIISSVATCLYISWPLSLMVFVVFPLILAPLFWLGKRLKGEAAKLQNREDSISSLLIDFLSGIHTIKIFAMERFSQKKYNELTGATLVDEARAIRYSVLMRPVLNATLAFLFSALFVIGSYYFSLTLSQLIIFCGLVHLMYDPIKNFTDQANQIQRGALAAQRLSDLMKKKLAIADPCEPIIADFQDSIEFDHVWFKYGEEWVLKDLSFVIKKGERVALIGPTGAGKSSIVQLLLRLYEPQQGEIRIDGTPIAQYSQESLRRLFSVVTQKPFLFLDTVAINIACDEKIEEDRIQNAAIAAHAHEFVSKLPLQYNAYLAEAGKNLSGGQQQRLTIARALYKQAPILVLDEGTSALDLVSEQKITATLHGLPDQTQIVITHRLSALHQIEHVIYLEQGKKIAEGAKSALLQECIPFRALWELHHGASAAPAQEITPEEVTCLNKPCRILTPEQK